jgi:hypothetical protein
MTYLLRERLWSLKEKVTELKGQLWTTNEKASSNEDVDLSLDPTSEFVSALCRHWTVLSRCLSDSYWKIDFIRLQIQYLGISVVDPEYRYSGHFNCIILFVVDILPLYAINLDVVTLFADSSFTFLAILNMWLYDVFYQFEWMSIFLFL